MLEVKGRILRDVKNPYVTQLKEAMDRSPSDRPKKVFEGPVYDDPRIHSFLIQKGPKKGTRKFVLQFKHKANPAWSRSFDVTDLSLIMQYRDQLEPALSALKMADLN